MKKAQLTRILFLLFCSNIYYVALSQDTTVHAVNDPVIMHYYTRHLFWVVLGLTVVVFLFYNNRNSKRKKLRDSETDT